MFLSIGTLAIIGVLVAMVVAISWAAGVEQGQTWTERAKKRRDKKKVRRWELDQAEARINALEDAAAWPTIGKERT